MSDKKESRRREILQAAMTAFAEKGYDKTTMDDIVRVGNLSKGTLYWHFKNKQDLFLEMVALMTEQAMELFDKVLHDAEQNDLSPPDALRTLFHSTADALVADPVFSAMTVDFFLQAFHDAAIMKRFTRYYVEFIWRVEQIIQKGIDSGVFRSIDASVAGAAIAGALDGISALTMLRQDLHDLAGLDVNIRSLFDTAANLMIEGLVKEHHDAS